VVAKAGGKGGKAFSGQCNYCKKTGHEQADCIKKKADDAKAECGMIQVLDSDGDECDMCMAVSSESAPVCLEKVVITLDGGSDVHLANARFCRGVPVLKTECRLRDVQQALIPVYGAAVVPLVLDKTIAVTSRFDIAENTQANLVGGAAVRRRL